MASPEGSAADFRIVKLAGPDAPRLHAFYLALEPAVVGFYEPYGAAPAREQIDGVLARADSGQDTAYALVDAADAIAGHVFIADLAGASPTFGIGMAERAHGKGWGRRLAKAVLADADAAAVPVVHLTVVKRNNRAHSLYRSLGFEVTGECTFRSANDSYEMQRKKP